MHELQPKHSKLKLPEVQELLESLNVHINQLPRIKSTDAAIKDLNCIPGDVAKIERKEGDKISVYYRAVV